MGLFHLVSRVDKREVYNSMAWELEHWSMSLSICPRFPSFLAASPGTELLGWQFMAGSPSSVCCPDSVLTLPGV